LRPESLSRQKKLMDTAERRGGGRPSRAESARLRDTILDIATELFLTQGFGATSIDAIAERARISKRTFYARFRDKDDLFEAVVRRFIEAWMPPFDATLHEAAPLEDVLLHAAGQIQAVALSQDALALHRVIVAEAQRFPELARIVNALGTAKGVERIAALLEYDRRSTEAEGTVTAEDVGDDSRFAAEHFIYMVLSVPQRRALGLGRALLPDELAAWTRRTVRLFLDGYHGQRSAP
jgi:TetR/AcrR family transcriptional regulator, mexJK operon transcriptional repressor